jgi:hypothetical protein
MIDPTTHAMGWRLGHQDERQRREAERELGHLTAQVRRWRWRRRSRWRRQ